MSSERKRGLGKGMSSLLAGFDYDAQVENVITKTIHEAKKDEKLEVVLASIDRISANPNQPRKSFDDEALEGLAESIRNQGILQPLTVEEVVPGRYSIIAGERRFRAAKLAGLEKVPVIISKMAEVQRIEASLIENIQREDLNAIEEAAAFDYLMKKSGYTQEEVAKKVGKSRSSVANSLRLLSLPDEVKDDVISGAMSAGHARAILSLVNPADRVLLREKIINNGISVREAEVLAETYNKGQKLIAKKKAVKKDEAVVACEQKFVSAVGARCELKGDLRKGKLQIKYRSQRDLERLYSLLSNGGYLFEE